LGKTKGTELTPGMILSLLPGKTELLTLDNNNIEESMKQIGQRASSTDNCVFLGGDHSITYATMKALCEKKKAGIIVFDAHPDIMQPFSVPTHENYLRQLIEEGILPASNVILVGIRAGDDEEQQYIKKNNIAHFSMDEIAKEGIHNTCDAVMAAAKDFEALYVSIDIDVVDPAFAPGTGYPEVGGLTSRELLYFLARIKFLKNLRMIDVVEINPTKDINDITLKLGLKIIQEFS